MEKDGRARSVNGLIECLAPQRQTMAAVFASPHSGAHYTDEFVASSRLDPVALRRSEDSFVDEIFAAAPVRGAPLLRAHFPRVYVDPNREPYELDPIMFEDGLPDYVNTSSPRVAAGTRDRGPGGGERRGDLFPQAQLRRGRAAHRVAAIARTMPPSRS